MRAGTSCRWQVCLCYASLGFYGRVPGIIAPRVLSSSPRRHTPSAVPLEMAQRTRRFFFVPGHTLGSSASCSRWQPISRTELGVTYLPSTISSDAGYADIGCPSRGARNGTWGPPEQRRTEGRHGRGGRLRIPTPANYRAASRLAGSTTTRAASRGRCAAPPHERPVTCTGRAARWARRTRGRRRLCRRERAAAFVPAACGAAAWQASDTRRGRALGCTQSTAL